LLPRFSALVEPIALGAFAHSGTHRCGDGFGQLIEKRREIRPAFSITSPAAR
jgi:hypothetical protein